MASVSALAGEVGPKPVHGAHACMQGRFENASVEFDEVALAPTYRLQWGIPGRSNALSIAARWDMGVLLLGLLFARLQSR